MCCKAAVTTSLLPNRPPPDSVHPNFHAQCLVSCSGTEIFLGVVFQLAAEAAASLLQPKPGKEGP